ncbi:S8 family peptidase [uncultured Cloacibacillus sp.]|uniref:S8 family peptidase n=1 Tax=uncultured Cloacibacillus sp. TaxID=889794 RepID=UPI0026DCBD42|nr:S8 family peptidase [uncultured Cloacibacillus sp.]
MNPLLQVKLRFDNERNTQQVVAKNLRANASTSDDKVCQLIESLRAVNRFYKNSPKVIENMLIDVNYNDIIAKSNRIQALLKPVGRATNDIIVGARFSAAEVGAENHVITYYVDPKTVGRTIGELEIIRSFIQERLNGKATPSNFNETRTKRPNIDYDGYGLSKPKIRNLIVDCSVVESFSIPGIDVPVEQESYLITFYKTELSIDSLLEKLNVNSGYYRYTFYGDDTISATKELYQYLSGNVPYLISMVSSDLSKITLNDIGVEQKLPTISIPDPANEPTIGVIDTLFDESVYFSKWVENNDYLDLIEKPLAQNSEREHGTEVTSIIVDGPRLNPGLDDGCGRFKVRHFGVCDDKISVSRLVRKIKDIVSKNPDIHVWNLSLGTEDEVSKNFISYDAAEIDELTSQGNVIFVISGTNDNRSTKDRTLRVGSPADSLNSIVVNSVRRDRTPATYSRKGNVLSFFNKPDVSYYGGDHDERIIVYSPIRGEVEEFGTSFAAPWISRKLCYLIDIMGLSREVAKALIIDSAAGWEYKTSTYKMKDLIGYGIVPISINSILETSNDEIRFVVYGVSESYKTANYAIPVPKDEDNNYPYIARATMCYFPKCSRSQGVDYTNRELSLKFGRVKPNGSIEDINDNIQDDAGAYVDERASRREFRKWENTKFISKIHKKNRPLKSYDERFWGISVVSKERLSTKMQGGLNFAAVITLKEIQGINRIQYFITACNLRGYIVNQLNMNAQVEVYNANQEEITFE